MILKIKLFHILNIFYMKSININLINFRKLFFSIRKKIVFSKLCFLCLTSCLMQINNYTIMLMSCYNSV